MNNTIKKYIGFAAAFTLLYTAMTLPQGCKKVDQYYDDISGRPQVNTREDGDYNVRTRYGNAGYKSVYAVGDTATWTGQFFLEKGLPVIRIGNADAVILVHDTFTPFATTAAELNEMVRFVITEEMGVGANRPVTVRANGITVSAPDITINAFTGLDGRTDTTLFVEKLATWQPDNPEDYFLTAAEKPGSGQSILSWVTGGSATLDNTVYFNNARGVFRIRSVGNVEEWLGFNETLAEKGATFRLHYIINAVPDARHSTVYVSARVTENSTDTLNNYIFRLMQIDPVDKSVVTLNRTLVPKDPTDPAITAEPLQGPLADVPLVATCMTWAPTGLYFCNAAPAKPMSKPDDLKRFLYGIYQNDPDTYQQNTFGVNTLCQLDTASHHLRVLMHSGDNANAGFKVNKVYTYRVRPDGKMIYTIPENVPAFGLGLTYYDIALGQSIFTKAAPQTEMSMQFVSFDTDSATQYLNAGPHRLNNIKVDDPWQWTIAGNGNIISYFATNFDTKPSLFAAKIDASRMYCYAGTEKGMFTNPDDANCLAVPVQDQETGPAKFVVFGEQDCSLPFSNSVGPRFLGSELQGSLYFYKYSLFGSAGQTNRPACFYRVYPKK